MGFDDKFNYRKIEYSLAYLNNGATFIGTNIDRTYVVNDHIVSAGGTMVKAIEYASGKEAIIIGKPNRRGYDLIKEE